MYKEHGNMSDINRMDFNEFARCIEYISTENKRSSGKFVPLNKQQERLIEEAKKCQRQEAQPN